MTILLHGARNADHVGHRATDADDSHARPLRLAVYGHLNRDCGSSPGSHYILIEYLLAQGHHIDLYAVGGFVEPQELHRYPNLNYIPTSRSIFDRILSTVQKLPTVLGWAVAWVVNTARMRRYYKLIGAMIGRRHHEQPYDALLVLDVASPFPKIESLPCFNWAQGSPSGEWDALRRQKETVIRYGSRFLYWALGIYYAVRIALARKLECRIEHLICCSRWTAGCWEKLGLPADRISVIPFTIDLQTFSPRESRAVAMKGVTFLHLGRVVPRKRIDLLLKAFQLLRREIPDARLLIVGRFVYPRGLKKLLSPTRLPEGVEYRKSVTRDCVPELINEADVMVQTSENEDYGSAVMESLACGVPVVVGPTNGTAEYGGQGAFRFESYTAECVRDALRDAATAVCEDSAVVRHAARSAAERHFAVRRVASAVLSLVRAEAPQKTNRTPTTRMNSVSRKRVNQQGQ